MRLSTKGEYALLALVFLARRGRGTYVKIDEICAEYAIPKKYLEQLLLVLKRGGMVKTKTGPAGGYALARDPEVISIAQIARLMDGTLCPTKSVSRYFYKQTPLEKEAKLKALMVEVRDRVVDLLEEKKLADVV